LFIMSNPPNHARRQEMTTTLERANATISLSTPSKMQAAVVTGPGTIAIQEVPVPEPLAGEALVRLEGMALLAGLPLAAARAQLSTGLDLLVVCARGPDGVRERFRVIEPRRERSHAKIWELVDDEGR
jgi:hypothetical protein